jgi:hypothetical protein
MKAAARLLLVALPLVCAACSSNDTAAPTPAITDTFNGTVAVGGSDFHNVTVNSEGQIDVTLTSAGPPSTIVEGLAVGTPSGTACSPIQGASKNTGAGSGAQISGTVTAGVLCVQVSDIGNQTAPITYTLTVVHP